VLSRLLLSRKKKKISSANFQLNLLGIRRKGKGERCGAARSSRTYSARLHAAACTTQDVSVDIGFAMHRGILQFSFRLASSLFRQLALLSLAAFQSSSIFNPRFHFFPSLSV